VPWDGKAEGSPTFVTDGQQVWILSGGYGETNVFRLDRGSTVPRPVPVPRMYQLFAGDGQLWGVQLLRGGRAERLVYIDVRNGYRLRPKRFPRGGCKSLGRKTLVHRGRLWFQCDWERFIVYEPQQVAPVKELRELGDLVESAKALWLYNINSSLECVEGPCRGRDIVVGPSGAWAAEGDTGWVLREGATATEALLTLVGFRARGYADFTVKVPREVTRPYELRVVGDELWVHSGSRKFAVARYRLNAPDLAPRLLRLPGVSWATEAGWPVEVGGGYAWISAGIREGVKVFRVALPRDPPALRRIRAAVLVASVRTPQRLGVARGAGAPMHASCDARGLYLTARAYYCTVRFRGGAEYMCVAVVRGRVLADRRHSPKWACG
jgi:hypothetical protein